MAGGSGVVLVHGLKCFRWRPRGGGESSELHQWQSILRILNGPRFPHVTAVLLLHLSLFLLALFLPFQIRRSFQAEAEGRLDVALAAVTEVAAHYHPLCKYRAGKILLRLVLLRRDSFLPILKRARFSAMSFFRGVVQTGKNGGGIGSVGRIFGGRSYTRFRFPSPCAPAITARF